ncbi:uncharacterized protein LOC106655293 [Trichogramma pretiosum]|uniref:uncharacterized protein LOC106655293 n=1 Tax=Trichogramma pretiosum TaxID=7493 RepID=UPI0006C9776D|nr:uncharacterized protein LOC106655293 [Trichogramma pretiosum]
MLQIWYWIKYFIHYPWDRTKSLVNAVETENFNNGTAPYTTSLSRSPGWLLLNSLCNQPKLTRADLKWFLEKIQPLIQFKAEQNYINMDGNTSIMSLFINQRDYKLRMKLFELLLENGADITLVNKLGDTILHIILELGQQFPNIVRAVELLLKRGADVNAQNFRGETALHKAAYSHSLKVMELLLKNGARPNIVTLRKSTALNYICDISTLGKVHLKMIQLLIRYEADVNIKDSSGHSPLLNLFKNRKYCENQYWDCKIVFKIFKLLVENGADDKIVDTSGEPIMHMIADFYAHTSWIAEAFDILLKRMEGEDRIFALHNAVRRGQVKVVASLFKCGANPNMIDAHLNIPLNYTFASIDTGVSYISEYIFKRYLNILKINIENKANLSHIGGIDGTILHSIIIKLSSHIFRPRNTLDENYIKAILKYTRTYIEILLQNGLDVNVEDRNGRTPLNEAASHFNYDIVEFLLSHGADVQTVTFEGGFLREKLMPLQNLRMTLNVQAVIEELEDHDFQMTHDHYFSIFKFLIVPNEPLKFEFHSDILQLGSRGLIKKLVESLPSLNAYETGALYDCLIEHLQFVQYGMMYMDIETHNYLQKKCETRLRSRPITHLRNVRRVKEELDLARNRNVGNNISLLDLCTSNPDKTYKLLKNSDYLSALNNHIFKYKTIGAIIRGCVTKSLIRNLIKHITCDVVVQFFGLPFDCCLEIITYLDSEDIFNVYRAAFIEEL